MGDGKVGGCGVGGLGGVGEVFVCNCQLPRRHMKRQ